MTLFEIVEKRRSVRKYKPDPVKEKDLKEILEAGRLAPSASNRQPWSFVVTTDPETKKSLAVASNNQMFIAEAHVVITALGDPSLYQTAASQAKMFHLRDPMIAIEHVVLAATALGYGTCWIGAFNEAEVKKILKIPERLAVVALLPLGVPDVSPPAKPRKEFREVFFKDSYGVSLEL